MAARAMGQDLYLDYNGSTPVDIQVREAHARWLDAGFGNAAAAHPEGQRARAAIAEARETIAAGLGAEAREIWFTSGGTESNNWALLGSAPRRGGHLIVSAIEHRSVLRTAEHLAAQGCELTVLPVGAAGVVAADDVVRELRPDTFVVSVMLANNETGVVQPAREIAAACRERGVRYHCDAVCVIGKLAVDVRAIDCDLLSLSSHKLYAPKGCGVLYVRGGVALRPLIHGCGQQDGMRSGTENTVGVVAFARAFERMREGAFRGAELEALRDRLWAGITACFPGALINGEDPRLPNTLSVSFPGFDAPGLQAELGRAGISVAAGAAASGGAPSHVLTAMGLPAERVRSTLRFSLGVHTTRATIDHVVLALESILASRAAFHTTSAR
jgi:cysteine desulfurase